MSTRMDLILKRKKCFFKPHSEDVIWKQENTKQPDYGISLLFEPKKN